MLSFNREYTKDGLNRIAAGTVSNAGEIVTPSGSLDEDSSASHYPRLALWRSPCCIPRIFPTKVANKQSSKS